VTFTNAIIFINSINISYDKFVYSQFSNGVIIFKSILIYIYLLVFKYIDFLVIFLKILKK